MPSAAASATAAGPNSNKGALVEDRRRLIDHALQVFRSHGGRLQLPIGMTAAEPWLLDALDVPALLNALTSAVGAAGPGAATTTTASTTSKPPLPPAIDLLALCQRGARTATVGSRTHSRAGSSSRRTSDNSAEFAAPQLQLPALETGLSEAEVQDLAYLVFACNCPHEADLLDSVRSNLDIDETRAAEAQRLLGLVNSAMREQAGPLAVSKAWSASLELPVCMLAVVLPRDFSRFRSFVMWRDTLSHVLLATLTQSVKEGWSAQQEESQQPQSPLRQQQPSGQQQQQQQQQLQLQSKGSGGGTAQQLMARLKAALRRLDVRDADDFDQEEYRAASAAVREQAQAIVQCTAAGWAFPWGLRVRLYEVLLRALFDSLDQADYVPDKDRYLQLLETRLRPLLGIAPPMHTAILAWVHFRQYVITQAPLLLSETRGLLYQLASIAADDTAAAGATAAGRQPGCRTAAGTSVTAASTAAAAATGGMKAAVGGGGAGAGGAAQLYGQQQDAVFASNVGQAVVDWILERLSDYHKRLEALGGPEAVGGLVDLLAFASTCRGASEEEVGRVLLEAVSLSVAAELHRRLDASAAAAAAGGGGRDSCDSGGEGSSQAARCVEVCRTAKELAAEEHMWTRGFGCQLPEAFLVVLAVLQEAVGAVLLPWLLSQPVLDEDACEALRCALDLEPRLVGPIRAAAAGAGVAGSCRYACTARLFACTKPWNMPAQLQPLLSAWLDKQMSGFSLWVDRQLQQEDWRPLGAEQPHSASARELRRIAMESLEALFGLQLPLPPATVRQYMQGIAGMMIRYLDAILSMLGSEAVMIPPTPHLTRYKREVAVAQEEAESQLPGMPTQQPAANVTNRKGVAFADSVRRAEDEPCAARVSGLTTPVLVVMMASLAYLAETLQLLSQGVKQMRQQEQEQQQGAGVCGSSSSSGGSLVYPWTGAGEGGYNASSSNNTSTAHNNPFFDVGDGDDASPGLLFNAGGLPYSRNSSSAGGGVVGAAAAASNSSSPAWAPTGRQQQPLLSQRVQPFVGGGPVGGWSQGSSGGGFGGTRDEQFGSLHDTGQRLRAGLSTVARWLAVRVVWWEQRAAWCELLYRHRVTSCRIDWLLDGLAATLQDHVSALPQQPPQDLYGLVALELLQQSARALERALLDGGPCRWYIPADVDHLRDDLEELRKLFFQAKVPMQDIRTSLLGLEGVLRLMAKQTGPLIESHKAARRAALLAGPAAPATPPSGAAAAAVGAATNGMSSNPFAGGGGGSSNSSSYFHSSSRAPPSTHAGSGRGGSGGGSSSSSSSATPQQQPLGPLAAAKLAKAGGQGSGSPLAATAGGGATDRGSTGASGRGGGAYCVGQMSAPQHSRHPTSGSIGSSVFDDAASLSSYQGTSSSNSPAPAGWGSAQQGSRGPAAATGGLNLAAAAAAAAGSCGGGSGGGGATGLLGGGVSSTRRTAMDVVAAGGDVEAQEPIVLRVLCHRADHAASKYLKDNMKIGKARDETIKEALGRFARLNRM